MISKTLLAKGVAGLATTSAVGTGAAKFFTTKNITDRVNEQLVKKFGSLENREVLERAGFRDALGDEEALKDSLARRLGREKATAENIKKMKAFCEKGLAMKFSGIHDVYQTLATVCTKAISLKNKVVREKRELSELEDIQTRLNTIEADKLIRKFFSKAADFNAESILKVCKEYGMKDVFEAGLDRTELADYMTYCVNSSVSSIAFWTGVESPDSIPEEKTIKQKLSENGLNVLVRESDVDNEKWSNNVKIMKGAAAAGTEVTEAEINGFKNRCEALLGRLYFEEREEEYSEAAQKCVEREAFKGKTVGQKLTEAGFRILDNVGDEDTGKWIENLKILKGEGIVTTGVPHDEIAKFKEECRALLNKAYLEGEKENYFSAAKKCVEQNELGGKLERVGLKKLENSDYGIISQRWSEISKDAALISDLNNADLADSYKIDISGKSYSQDLAVSLIGKCNFYSWRNNSDSEIERRWKSYLLFCAKDGVEAKYDVVKENDFWTNSPKN